MKKVSDIMTRDVDFVTPLDNVYEVAVKMKEDNVGVIPVCENDQVIGVITDRDIVIRGVSEKRPGSTKVTDIMSDDLYTGSPDMSVQEASELMAEKQIRRLPIVENNKMVGIISLGDLSLTKESDNSAGHALSEVSEQRDQLQ
ncbi:CBS domain-containing protein [Fictibacillus phosphorivorans]|uniref:CBS domain-containing protein n=1 Tax=Fictibacillus phosphorivorans TaxID=1221500 RepID=UPI00203B1F50|nr:CBS domain-containing protein [Fictibacillus phosphorivorans]MCM3717289.1 CBS domain-containing protein [Fictibacillus phosphorivorans]MCM3774976.1 CBS domain-containing protein [Fictibacillus phosphorivorans]